MRSYMQNPFTLNGESTSLRDLDKKLQIILQTLDSTNLFEVYLILEEIVSNIYIHGPQEREIPIVNVKLQINADKNILLIITDTGSVFDPTKKIELDKGDNLEERKIGGLGLFLIQNMVDTMSYSRTGGKNSLMITKKVIKPSD